MLCPIYKKASADAECSAYFILDYIKDNSLASSNYGRYVACGAASTATRVAAPTASTVAASWESVAVAVTLEELSLVPLGYVLRSTVCNLLSGIIIASYHFSVSNSSSYHSPNTPTNSQPPFLLLIMTNLPVANAAPKSTRSGVGSDSGSDAGGSGGTPRAADFIPNMIDKYDFLPGINKWDGVPHHDFDRYWFAALIVALGTIVQAGHTLWHVLKVLTVVKMQLTLMAINVITRLGKHVCMPAS